MESKYYPLTHAQKRIWYMEKMNDSSLNSIGGTVIFKEPVRLDLLENSIRNFVQSNDIFKLKFVDKHGEPKQYQLPFTSTDYSVRLFDFTKEKSPKQAFKDWVETESSIPFKMDEEEQLFYFALFKISESESGYLVKFHHLISDGWSIQLMTEHISDTYIQLIEGKSLQIDRMPSYLEYIEKEQSYLSSSRFKKDKDFWENQFLDLPDSTFLINSNDHVGKRKTYNLDEDLSIKINDFVTVNKCSMNTFFLSIYFTYLYRFHHASDLILGMPVLNRSGKKEKTVFGMFTSTMPVRYQMEENETFLNTVSKVNKKVMKCLFHQKYPYDLLIRDIQKETGHIGTLFNTSVNYYNTKLNQEINQIPIENVEFYNGNQLFDLQIIIKEWLGSGKLSLNFDYKLVRYSEEQINAIYESMIYLIEQVVLDPTKNINQYTIVTESSKNKQLYEFNDTNKEYPNDLCIHQLFEQQVEKTPLHIAVAEKEKEYTYQDVNRTANKLAHHLVKKGVKKGGVVGLLAENSFESVVGMFGIMKAGAAYVPIDPNYPIERIQYILNESDIQILLTTNHIELHEFNGMIVDLHTVTDMTESATNLNLTYNSSDLAYMIYTSGTTGKPKGTMIEHKGLVNYSTWAKDTYIETEKDTFAFFTSIAFDLTITSIYPPLINGNRLIVYREDERDNIYVLYRIINERKANIIKLTPSQMSLLKGETYANHAVKKFIVGGEKLTIRLAQDIYSVFNERIDILNEYGPTETVVGCMIHRFQPNEEQGESVSIGLPIQNVQIYLLDSNLQPIHSNASGDLYISGDGVARGYFKNQALTDEKFIPNPFIKEQKMYKSGDRGRFLADGTIEYINRNDTQVKIRGNRIELGEIESLLYRHEAIEWALVLDNEDKFGTKFLCVYFKALHSLTDYELISYLQRYIPDYMIPSSYTEIKEIPLTNNGKVDHSKLPNPLLKQTPIHSAQIEQATTAKEVLLLNVVHEVMGIEDDNVNINFYHLGGDSIKAIQVSAKLNERGYQLKPKQILANPIIKNMSKCIEENDKHSIDQFIVEGNIPATPILSWFLEQNFQDPDYYHQSILLKMEDRIEKRVIEKAMEELIIVHDALRMNFNKTTKEFYYNNKLLTTPFTIIEYQLGNMVDKEQYQVIFKESQKLKLSFDIENDCLIKAALFNLGQNEKRLLLVAHHIIIDGVSWRILFNDLTELVKAIQMKNKPKSLVKTHSYQKWAETLEQEKDLFKKELGDWQFVLSQSSLLFDVQGLHTEGTKENKIMKGFLRPEQTKKLITTANSAFHTETNDLLVTALLLALKEYSGHEKILLELESHGRQEWTDKLNLTRTVGWFTSMYPAFFQIGVDDLTHNIISVKEQIRSIPNGGIGYGVLRYLNKLLPSTGNQKFIRFNYLGDIGDDMKNEWFEYTSEVDVSKDSSENNHLTSQIDINAIIVNQALTITFEYSTEFFNEESLTRLMSLFIHHLTMVIDHCEQQQGTYTPSDFDGAQLSQDEIDLLFQ
nr:amino acid adenylation domain-containing protein [Mesobacillus maritimus]